MKFIRIANDEVDAFQWNGESLTPGEGGSFLPDWACTAAKDGRLTIESFNTPEAKINIKPSNNCARPGDYVYLDNDKIFCASGERFLSEFSPVDEDE